MRRVPPRTGAEAAARRPTGERGYDVDPAALAEHAARVAQVADRVERAAQTVGVGDVGGYGLLPGALLVPAFNPFFGDNVEIVRSAAEMGDAYPEAIRTMSTASCSSR